MTETDRDGIRQKTEQAETVRDRHAEREREFERHADVSRTATLFFHLAQAQVAWHCLWETERV